MPTYLDEQGNEIKPGPPSASGKIYLDDNGDPINPPHASQDSRGLLEMYGGAAKGAYENLKSLIPSAQTVADVGVPTVGAAIGSGLALSNPVTAPMAPLAGGLGASIAGGLHDLYKQYFGGEAPPGLVDATIKRLTDFGMGGLQEANAAIPAMKTVPKEASPYISAAENEAIKSAPGLGIQLDKAQVTGSPFWEGAKTATKRLPGSPGGDFAMAQKNQTLAAGTKIAEDLAPIPGSKIEAGNTLMQDMRNSIEDFGQKEQDAYQKLLNIANSKAKPVQVGQRTVGPAGFPGGQTVEPIMKKMAGTTDISEVKAQLKPIFDKLAEDGTIPEAVKQNSPGYRMLSQIMGSPDKIPLDTALENLSALKSIVRNETHEPLLEITSKSARLAKITDNEYHDAVSKAVDDLGPAAKAAWNSGREFTTNKYIVQGVLKDLNEEPVRAINKLVMPGDQSVNLLGRVKEVAPDQVPNVAKSWLTTALNQMTSGETFKGGTALTKWDNMGDETKKILFGPTRTQILDDFFTIGKIISKEANTSGTVSSMSPVAIALRAFKDPLRAAGEFAGLTKLANSLYNTKTGELINRTLLIKDPGIQNARLAAIAGRTALAQQDQGP